MRPAEILPWIFALVVGGAQAAIGAGRINPDAVSYLDISDAYLRHDWAVAFPAHWSPFLPFLIFVTRLVLSPGRLGELTLIHVLSWSLFVVSLTAFAVLVRELVAARDSVCPLGTGPATQWVAVSLFLWLSLISSPLSLLTPDHAVAALFFVQTAMLVRFLRCGGSLGWWVTFGVVIAVSYYVKMATLPVSLLTMVVLLFVRRRSGVSGRAAVSVLVALLLIAPFAGLLSVQNSRFTLGDSGRLNLAWFVAGVPPWTHWHPLDSRNGTPRNPEQIIFLSPLTYEFSSPFSNASYPPWYDPSYWFAGVRPTVPAIVFGKVFLSNVFSARCEEPMPCEKENYVHILEPVVFGAALLLAAIVRRRHSVGPFLALSVPWFVISAGALAMYAMVLVKGRYAFPYLLVIGMTLTCSVLDDSPGRPAVRAMLLVICAVLLMKVGVQLSEEVQRRQTEPSPGALVRGAAEAGIRMHDRVAVIGNGLEKAGLARLCNFRITAEVPADVEDAFWSASEGKAKMFASALRKHDVKWMVTCHLKRSHFRWRRIDGTPCFAVGIADGS